MTVEDMMGSEGIDVAMETPSCNTLEVAFTTRFSDLLYIEALTRQFRQFPAF